MPARGENAGFESHVALVRVLLVALSCPAGLFFTAGCCASKLRTESER